MNPTIVNSVNNASNTNQDTVRLAKRVADQFNCSRAEAVQYIEGGWISVDGTVCELAGARVAATQTVTRDDAAVLIPAEAVTILFHKPAGVIDTALSDPHSGLIGSHSRLETDRSAHPFLQRHTRDLALCGGLDAEASGLVVLTQDYRIVRKLVGDANRIEHELVVEVRGTMRPDGLDLLNKQASWNGKPINSLKVSWQSEQRLRFALKGLQAGMLTHLCTQVGLQILSVKRIRIGRIPLAPLGVGQWRYLMGFEQF